MRPRPNNGSGKSPAATTVPCDEGCQYAALLVFLSSKDYAGNALGGIEGKRIFILGAAFKAHTDDIRNSPALELANLLAVEGAEVRIADPVVPKHRIQAEAGLLTVVSTVAEGAAGAHAIVLATDWPEFVDFDFSKVAPVMERRVIFDGRNALDAEALAIAGFQYLCIGRPGSESAERMHEFDGKYVALGGS